MWPAILKMSLKMSAAPLRTCRLTGFDQLAAKRSSSLIRRWVTPWLVVAAERLDTELEGRFRSYALRGSARCRVRLASGKKAGIGEERCRVRPVRQ
jgi:hypothetical protein